MRQTRRRRQQWRLFLITLVLAGCSLVAASYGLDWAARLGAKREVTLPPSEAVGSGTRVVWVTDYSICGDQLRQESPPEKAMLGQPREQVQSLYPGWVVESFAADRIALRRSEPLCPLHRDNRTLKLVSGTLVIYYGTPERLGPRVTTVPDISPSMLAREDRIGLEMGITFTASDGATLDDQIQSYLEGISE